MAPKRKADADEAGTEPESATTVIVTLEEDVFADIEGVKHRLEEAGLEVEQVLDFIGQIVGKVSTRDVEPLREIKGVAAVEESKEIQLPPPDSLIL